jgi:nicotinate phosphoribosyltransferase
VTHGPRHIGLYTDLYEIRMVESYLRAGMTGSATFSLFARPSRERPFLVSAGLAAVLDVLERFTFGADEIAYLRGQGVSPAALDWLAQVQPSGELWAVPDGTVLLAGEPMLEMTAPLPVAQLLEGALMNASHAAALVATKAARLVRAARGRDVVDFGFRRAHGLETAVEAARAAYLGGASATSLVEAGRRFGVPIAGTMAHAFVQAFDRELDALREFALDHDATTLLVDTYDAVEGVAAAIQVAREMAGRGRRIAAIRIDSEPLLELGRQARRMLDQAGLPGVEIIASGGLDEARIAALTAAGCPYDSFGVGTDLVCSTDKPSLDIVYKLVEYAGCGRAKDSAGKATLPGCKQIYRAGAPERDVLELRGAPGEGRPLLAPAWRDGQPLARALLEEARQRARAALEELPDSWFLPPGPETPPEPALGPALAAEVQAERRRRRAPI